MTLPPALKIWAAPGLYAALLILGFAVRGSDQPLCSLVLSALWALFAAVLWLLPSRKADQRLAQPALGLIAAVFVLFCAVIVLEPVVDSRSVFDLSAFVTAFLKLMGLACAFLAGVRLCSDNDGARRIVDAILAGGTLWAIFAILMQAIDPYAIYGVAKIGDPRRLAAAFTSPNSAATLFGSLAVLAWGRTLSRFILSDRHEFFERIDPLYIIEFAVCATALIMSLSRSGWLATAAALAGLTMVMFRRRISLPLFAGGLIAVAAAVAVVLKLSSFTMVDRLVKLQADIDTRQMLFAAHAAAGMKHPVMGWGLGSFITINNSVVTADTYPALWAVRAAHNVYLQWFEETGFVGIGALVVLNLAVLGTLFAGAIKKKRMGDRLWAMLFAYLVFLIHGLTDYAFQETSLSLYVAMLLGTGFAMATRSEREAAPARRRMGVPRNRKAA
ncbi:O-antigen ligase family protein [Asticcacaulis solisilvae]|uniref:O-antigen ligase family protein n=1 Tax=Asticcacaulis solisilvae TaxID=1217274 RepID=UPI003FD7AC99